jgi:ribulose-5-phosphate 4-epimerase/fuculose-1-phosphate aldolase
VRDGEARRALSTGEVRMDEGARDLADQLAAVGREAVGRGLVVASGGNLSARSPGHDAFVITGAGTWLDRLRTDDFSLVGLDGAVLGGNPRPSTEWRLHRRTYQVRADVNAVVHLHPQTAVVVDALGHAVRMLTLDHATYLRRIERVPYLPTGSDELADAAAEAARVSDAIILAHHGCSTLGDTVEMAWRRALNLEEAAVNTFRCLQLGDTTTTFPPEAMETVRHP